MWDGLYEIEYIWHENLPLTPIDGFGLPKCQYLFVRIIFVGAIETLLDKTRY